MREIKFRGRSSKDNKTWFTGSLVSLTDIDEAYIDHYDGLRRVIERYPVNPATVGQFTGLYDCDGHEIYEGDVLEASKTTVLVEWGVDGWVADCFTLLEWLKLHESHVIGNIYDSPELLEVEHD